MGTIPAHYPPPIRSENRRAEDAGFTTPRHCSPPSNYRGPPLPELPGATITSHLPAPPDALSSAPMIAFRNTLAPCRTHGLKILHHLSKPCSMSMASGNPKAAPTKHLIEKKLTEGLAPALLQVEDVSHQHAGHAGAPKGSSETHFNVTVVSDQFQGRTLLKRHRLVYDLLHEELQHGGVHALSLNTKTPAEVAPKP